MFRRLASLPAYVTALLLSLVLATGQARANGDAAGAYVQEGINKGLAVLGNKSLADADRRAQFRDLILSYTDAQKIAYFTLGNHRRGADAAVLADFVEAFKDYAVAVYESRLLNYSNQTLNVTGSVERNATDFVVEATLDDGGTSYNVGFRVLGSPGSFQIVDIMVEGIWLAVDQRSQFDSYLAGNGGNIAALATYLREQTVSIRAGN